MNQSFEDLAIRELTDMVGLARSSGESNRAILERLQTLYEGLGWKARQYPIAGPGEPRANLVVSNGDDPSILFDIHTDTVPPGNLERWTETGGNPRTLTRNADRLYGLGTSDTLGSGAVLNTLAIQGRLPRGTAIAYTADEEVGAIGATHLTKAGGIPDSVNLIVVCEPTNNLVVRGQKGFVPFDVVARGVINKAAPGGIDDDDVKVIMIVGQEAHSARPFQGKNALFEMTHPEHIIEVADAAVLGLDCHGIRNKLPGLAVISWAHPADLKAGGTHHELNLCRVLDFLIRFQGIAAEQESTTDDHFKPPQVTMNVGAVDVEGEDLVFSCDMRPVPGCDFRAILDRVLIESKAAFKDADLRYPHAPLPPVWTDLDEATEDALAGHIDEFGKSAYTEAAIFSPAGFRTLIGGPGNLLVHRPNEHIEVPALATGGDLYEKIATLVTGS